MYGLNVRASRPHSHSGVADCWFRRQDSRLRSPQAMSRPVPRLVFWPRYVFIHESFGPKQEPCRLHWSSSSSDGAIVHSAANSASVMFAVPPDSCWLFDHIWLTLKQRLLGTVGPKGLGRPTPPPVGPGEPPGRPPLGTVGPKGLRLPEPPTPPGIVGAMGPKPPEGRPPGRPPLGTVGPKGLRLPEPPTPPGIVGAMGPKPPEGRPPAGEPAGGKTPGRTPALGTPG